MINDGNICEARDDFTMSLQIILMGIINSSYFHCERVRAAVCLSLGMMMVLCEVELCSICSSRTFSTFCIKFIIIYILKLLPGKLMRFFWPALALASALGICGCGIFCMSVD